MYLAKARGYYSDAGLDVSLFGGQGSNSTLQLIGSGNQTIGAASLSALALAVGKGVPVIGFAGIMQKAPESVISLAGTKISQPKDLDGKRFGLVPGDQAQRLFEAFASKTGVDLASIKRVALNQSNSISALLNGDVDFITGWANSDALKVSKIKPISKPLVFADYGINTLGTGLFTTKATVSKNPDMLKRFMAATIRGAEDVAKDPKAGVEAVVKAVPTTDAAVITEQMGTLPTYFHTESSAGHPFGWVAPADVAQTLDIQVKYFGLSPDVKPSDVYTSAFFENA